MTDNNRKYLRIVVTILIIIAACAIGVAAWVAQHYKTIVKQKLPGWVAKSTDSVYKASFKDISINIFTRRITVYDLRLSYDTVQIRRLNERGAASKTYFSVNIPELQIKNISWEELLGDKNLSCEELYVIRPKLSIAYVPWLVDSLKSPEAKKPKIERLFAGSIHIEHANVIYKNFKDRSVYSMGDGDIVLNHWEFKPGQPKDSNRFVYANNGTIAFNRLQLKKPGSLYEVKLGKIFFSSAGDSLQISDLKISPALNETDFHKQVGHQSDMFHVHIPLVSASGMNWEKILATGAIYIDNVSISDALITDYFSRLVAPNTKSKLGQYPHQLLQKLKIPIYINNVEVYNATIKYTELSNVTKIPATLVFSGVWGSIKNTTNIAEQLDKDKNCIIRLKGKFMSHSEMAATFNLLLTDTAGAFSITSYMKNLEAYEVSKQTEALSLVGIKSLHGSKLELSIQGNEHYAKGKITMEYSDLKIKLKKMTDDSTLIKNKTFTSFFANSVFLLPANPMPGEPLRVAETSIIRNPAQSFFNLIWKNILQGIQKTIAKNDEAVKIMEAQGQTKPDSQNARSKKGILRSLFSKNKDTTSGPKKGFFKRLFGKKKKATDE